MVRTRTRRIRRTRSPTERLEPLAQALIGDARARDGARVLVDEEAGGGAVRIRVLGAGQSMPPADAAKKWLDGGAGG